MTDVVGAGDDFIPQEQYELIQAKVPILCVDLLPLRTEDGAECGLILRETYDGGTGWCLIGGAVLRDEPLQQGVLRHLRATLGAGFTVDLATLRMREPIEYFTDPTKGAFHDPRKHAVALTYSAVCHGQPGPRGEALDFRWYHRDELTSVPFGFGQGKVVARVLSWLP